jgi:dihydrofolate reductase
VEGDVFFPETDPEEWTEIWREAHQPDEKNEYAFTFRVLERKIED